MERTPFTSELPEDDGESTPQRQRRPFEVLSDWLADRQRMLVEQDDEDEEDEDDSGEVKKRRRIGRTLRGLFRKNVSREEVATEVTPDETPVVTVPERSFLGNIIEVDEPVDAAVETPEEPEATITPVAPATPEAPTVVAPEEDEDEEPATVTPAASTSAPTTSGSGAVGGGIPPVAVGGPPALGGNSAPQPDPVVIEREPVIEHHHHNRGAALAALVVAERIDHHRNKKRKEQIKKVEKTQAQVNKRHEERIRTLEQTPVRTPEQPEAHKERPIIPVVPRREVAPRPENVDSRPQSVKEVLENRPIIKERAPSLADLEHRPTQRTEQIEDDDILVTAEKLATHAKETGIAHEVFDERWHEIKDPKTPLGTSQTDAADASTPVQAPVTAPPQMSHHAPQAAMIDPNRASQTTPAQPKTPPSGLWVALVIGVVVAIALILSRI